MHPVTSRRWSSPPLPSATVATRPRPRSGRSTRRWWLGSGSEERWRCSERSWPPGHHPRRACAGSRASTPHGSAASSRARSPSSPRVEYGLALIVLLALVALVVVRPLVRGDREPAPDPGTLENLDAAKQAKYPKTREGELAHEMG